jgi:hypothetical protein
MKTTIRVSVEVKEELDRWLGYHRMGKTEGYDQALLKFSKELEKAASKQIKLRADKNLEV